MTGSYYNSTRWRRLRRIVLADAGGVCEVCRVRWAKAVHHRVPLDIWPQGLFSRPNLQAVCQQCHSAKGNPKSRERVRWREAYEQQLRQDQTKLLQKAI